jgi:archaellum component FlaG (FlaF/FlaG flagellin family)
VTGYSIFYTTSGSNTFELLESAIPALSYTTQIPLVTGTTYKFYVKAENSVGLGLSSNTISVLLA